VRAGAAQTGEYTASDGLEPRLGIEWSRLLGRMAIQLRAGAYSQAPGSLAYSGPDTTEQAAFAGSRRRTLTSFGGTLAVRSGLNFDGAVTAGGDRVELAVGSRIRF
jgi:hypothetical protein